MNVAIGKRSLSGQLPRKIARSQHENRYCRMIENRLGATAKNFFSQRTCTIAAHDEKIGTASLGRRRKQHCDWTVVGSDRSWFGSEAMPCQLSRYGRSVIYRGLAFVNLCDHHSFRFGQKWHRGGK